jgi:hypothetical protein
MAGGNVILQAAGSAAACNHTITAYQWVSSDPTNHPVSSANTAATTVTAPTSGSFAVTVTVLDDAMPQRTDVATVTISPTAATTGAPSSAASNACLGAVAVASPVTVSVSPASASLQVGMATQAFSATVTDTTNTAVSWQVNQVPGGNATLGTISAAGVYTPPATVSGTLAVTVTAVSLAVKTQRGSAQVVVTAPPSSGGGGMDALTLLAAALALARRKHLLASALRHPLRNVEPFLLRPAVVPGRNARLLEQLARNPAGFIARAFRRQ